VYTYQELCKLPVNNFIAFDINRNVYGIMFALLQDAPVKIIEQMMKIFGKPRFVLLT